jgi:manganese efflux pump family protein
MSIFTLLILALGLCFDTFAVSISSGLVMNRIDFFNAMKIAFSLAFFQGLMPVLGWFLGSEVSSYIRSFDHWLALLLLAFIGIRMIMESLRAEEERKSFNPLNPKVLVTMSIATSIDALIVGFTLAFVEVNILWAGFIIGAVTFIASMLGILFGKKTGERFGKRLEILGGVILILIGLKIFAEHQFQLFLF